jgi:hypothetical protein
MCARWASASRNHEYKYRCGTDPGRALVGRKKRGEKPRRTCLLLTLQVGLSIKSRTVRTRLLHKKKITRQKSEPARSRLAGLKKTSEERTKANLTLSGLPPGGPCGAPVRIQARFTNTCKDASRRALWGPCRAWRPGGSFTIAQIID